MTEYRLLLLDADGDVTSFETFYEIDDANALARFASWKDIGAASELWSDGRRVDGAPSRRSLALVTFAGTAAALATVFTYAFGSAG